MTSQQLTCETSLRSHLHARDRDTACIPHHPFQDTHRIPPPTYLHSSRDTTEDTGTTYEDKRRDEQHAEFAHLHPSALAWHWHRTLTLPHGEACTHHPPQMKPLEATNQLRPPPSVSHTPPYNSPHLSAPPRCTAVLSSRCRTKHHPTKYIPTTGKHAMLCKRKIVGREGKALR
jgi:hypothetical protein